MGYWIAWQRDRGEWKNTYLLMHWDQSPAHMPSIDLDLNFFKCHLWDNDNTYLKPNLLRP